VLQSKEAVRERIASFWETELLSLRATKAIVLIVSHGGVINRLKEYLKSQNYRIRESARVLTEESWNWEVRNCSISEIVVGTHGPGEIIRTGDCQHFNTDEVSSFIHVGRLENSTGEE
jgi:broad specificity phosphatase PhoE